ncbi:MAG TPA: NADP-dependent oxidoreductase [Acidimicrobiia bacterium]|nr:NADP-dependent oxidoreductase [Acidimicrobiia bacterium]
MPKSRAVHLVARPEGLPTEADFAVVESEVGDPGDGEVLVENLYMSVDPAMRPRLTVGYELDQPMGGSAIGRIVASRTDAFSPGDLVLDRFGFREYFVSPPEGLQRVEPVEGLPVTVHLHALGGTGFTAYGGILKVAALQPEDKVFVSTAAGAVGSVAAQIAKIKGCWVLGSTGSAEKARWLSEEVGLDAVVNYKETPIRRAIHEAAPEGIDVYFDNVGGDHLDAALAVMHTLGRVAVCGMISGYNEPGARTVVRNLANVIYGRITIRGFTAADYPELRGDFVSDMTRWLREGRVKYEETVLHGIDAAPRALIGLFEGLNTGKMLVQLAE